MSSLPAALWRPAPLVGLLAIVASLVSALGGHEAARAASSTVVVSMNVPSAISITNSCNSDAARKFGVVQPGTTALTASGANMCRVSFNSTNDTSMLRISQSDGSGSAMGRATGNASRVGGNTELRSVAMSTASVGHAVGQNGRIMRTTDGGVTWASVASPTGDNLLTVDAPSALVAYAAGFGGAIIKTTDGGATWNLLAASPGGIIEGIDAISDTTIFAARDGGVYTSVDGGGSWANLNVGATNGFGPLAAFDVDTQIVAGWSGSSRRRDGGAWSSVNIMSPLSVFDLEYSSATVVWAVGEGGVRRSTDAGASWSNVSPAHEDPLRAISTSSPTAAVVTGDRGEAWSTNDGGTTWTRLDLPTVNAVNAMHAVGSVLVTAGTSDTLLRSVDGGATWSVRASLGNTMLGVEARTRLAAVAVGGAGTIRTTSNGGGLWTTRASGTTAHLRDVSIDGDHGWAVGDNGAILRTDDGGTTWVSQASGISEDLHAVAAASRYVGWAVGDGGKVLRTVNGGSTWFAQVSGTTANLRSVAAPGDQVAWAVGGAGTVLRTTDGGATWAVRPSGTTRLLRAVDASDAAVATFLTDVDGYRATTDGGATWAGPTGQGQQYDLDIAGEAVYRAAADVVRQSIANGPSTVVHWSFDTFYAVDAVDENTFFAVGESDVRILLDAPSTFADYGGANLWTSAPTTSHFGACLQAVGASTTADWVVDATGTPGSCEPTDADPWRAVPATPSKVARVLTAGQTGSIDIVFGVKVGTTVPAGRYTAGVTFEALAPNA